MENARAVTNRVMPGGEKTCSILRAIADSVTAALILAGAALFTTFTPFRRTRY
jgi:hypothetical protein